MHFRAQNKGNTGLKGNKGLSLTSLTSLISLSITSPPAPPPEPASPALRMHASSRLFPSPYAVKTPAARDRVHRHKMAVVQNGRNAITHWKVLKRFEKVTFLECTLETGRTHQIRVHMKSIGHPVVGDITYGKKNDVTKQMMLHSYRLIFTHPRTKKEIKLETKMPERFTNFLQNQVK